MNQKKKKILFLVTSLSWKKFKQFNIEMSKYYEMLWITIDPNIYYSFRRNGFSSIQLLDFDKIYDKNKKLILSEIQKIVDHNVNKYNILNLRNIFLAANMYKTLNPYKAYNIKEYYLKFISLIECFETFLDNHNVDIILQWLGAEVERRMLRIIAEKRNIVHIVFEDSSPIKGSAIFFAKNEYFSIYNIKLKRISIADAKKYLEEYIKEKINFIHPKRKQNSINFLKYFKKLIKIENKIFCLKSIIRQKNKKIRWSLRNLFKYIISFWLYKAPPLNKKIIFFPLHDIAESQVTVRSNGFIDQVLLLKLISLNVSDNYQILVKEHPNVLGKMRLNDLLSIRRLGNISLVNPKISAHALIKLSDIIMTINSTVGFEAILYQKPVITFGKSFYRGRGLTLDINSINKIPEKVKEAEIFSPKYEEVLNFLKDIMEISIEGNFECPQLLVQNIHRFCDIYFSK